MATEQLYSRQNYTYGASVTARLHETRVHIVGWSGVGFEIAKNLLLSGVRAMTIEPGPSERSREVPHALRSLYALPPDVPSAATDVDVVERCLPFLRELNPQATISVRACVTAPNNADAAAAAAVPWSSHMDILIVTAAREHWADWNARCRRDNVWFLGAQVVGFAGVV